MRDNWIENFLGLENFKLILNEGRIIIAAVLRLKELNLTLWFLDPDFGGRQIPFR